jgi:hypothetical protein
MSKEKRICSMPYKAGNKKESSWPPPRKLRGYRGKFYLDPVTGKLIPGEPPRKVSETAFVLPDEIPETESMATAEGKRFTSRSRLFEHYRQHGYECTGGDHLGVRPEPPDPKKQMEELRADAERAYFDIKYDRVQSTEYEKELCRQEENAFQAYKKRQ